MVDLTVQLNKAHLSVKQSASTLPPAQICSALCCLYSHLSPNGHQIAILHPQRAWLMASFQGSTASAACAVCEARQRAWAGQAKTLLVPAHPPALHLSCMTPPVPQCNAGYC